MVPSVRRFSWSACRVSLWKKWQPKWESQWATFDTITIAAWFVCEPSSERELERPLYQRPNRRRSMQNHEHFEELCALAAVGQLSPDEYGELEMHLTACGACQETLRDMAVVTDSWVPATSLLDHGVSTVRLRTTSSLRENFIARARDRGLNLTRQSETRSGIWAQWPFYRIKPYLAATAVAVFVVSIAFFLIRIDHRTRQVTNQAQVLGTQLGALQHENASLKQEIAAEQ